MGATYEQVSKHIAAQREQQFRSLLQRDYGKGKYRITKNGEVHAYGKMPNSIETGWWFVGYADEVARSYTL